MFLSIKERELCVDLRDMLFLERVFVLLLYDGRYRARQEQLLNSETKHFRTGSFAWIITVEKFLVTQ